MSDRATSPRPSAEQVLAVQTQISAALPDVHPVLLQCVAQDQWTRNAIRRALSIPPCSLQALLEQYRATPRDIVTIKSQLLNRTCPADVEPANTACWCFVEVSLREMLKILNRLGVPIGTDGNQWWRTVEKQPPHGLPIGATFYPAAPDIAAQITANRGKSETQNQPVASLGEMLDYLIDLSILALLSDSQPTNAIAYYLASKAEIIRTHTPYSDKKMMVTLVFENWQLPDQGKGHIILTGSDMAANPSISSIGSLRQPLQPGQQNFTATRTF